MQRKNLTGSKVTIVGFGEVEAEAVADLPPELDPSFWRDPLWPPVRARVIRPATEDAPEEVEHELAPELEDAHDAAHRDLNPPAYVEATGGPVPEGFTHTVATPPDLERLAAGEAVITPIPPDPEPAAEEAGGADEE